MLEATTYKGICSILHHVMRPYELPFATTLLIPSVVILLSAWESHIFTVIGSIVTFETASLNNTLCGYVVYHMRAFNRAAGFWQSNQVWWSQNHAVLFSVIILGLCTDGTI